MIGAALIFRVALLVAVIFWQGEGALLVSDAPRFYKIASALVEGHGFTLGEPPYTPSAFFPPVFLSVLGGSLALSGSVIPAVLLHIILGSLLPLLVWKIAGFITQNHGVRLLAAGLAAFEPQMILWSIVPTTEMIATFTMIAAFYFFLKLLRDMRWQDAALSGLFLGVSTLTRPHGQFLFILGALFLLAVVIKRFSNYPDFKRPLATWIVFAGMFVIVVSPWLVRNYYHFGILSISTTGPRNIYSDYAVAVRSLKTGTPFGEMRSQMYEELAQRYSVSSKEIREDPALGSKVAKEGFQIILSHPKESLQVLLIALNAFFTQDLYTFYLEHFRVIPKISFDFSPSAVLVREGPLALMRVVWEKLGISAALPALARIFWIFLDVLALIGVIVSIKKGGMARAAAILMAVVILYYAATSAVGAFSDQGRLRYPVNSLIFILASFGLVRSWERLTLWQRT